MNTIPCNLTPQCAVLEGMFIINTSPLATHTTFGDYALFLMRCFILTQFNYGCREVHILFDNPGRLQLPKTIERQRRDATAIVIAHTCETITSMMPIPPKWRDCVINCHTCKRSLTVFLANYWLHKISPYLQDNTVLYVAGGFEGDIEDTTWCVSDQSSPQPLPLYRSNAEETDTQLWLHVHHLSATNIYVVSPDTDIYHIGLPLDLGDKHILIQINTAGSSQKKNT